MTSQDIGIVGSVAVAIIHALASGICQIVRVVKTPQVNPQHLLPPTRPAVVPPTQPPKP